MFQWWNTYLKYIMLRAWHRTDAAAYAPSRELDAARCSCGPGGLCPEDHAQTWTSVWLREGWGKDTQEEFPNPPCDLPCPASSCDLVPWG